MTAAERAGKGKLVAEDDDGGVHEAVAAAARMALMVAMQAGQHIARERERIARELQHRDEVAGQALTAQLDADRGVAVVQLAVVERPDWWQHAQVQDIAPLVRTAAAWREREPRAAHALEVIDREVQQRFGTDLAALTARDERARAGRDRGEALEATAVADALDSVSAAGDHHPQDPADRSDAATERPAQMVAATADAASGGGEAGAEREHAQAAWDSAERRRDLAATIEGTASADVTAGRIRADIGQGQAPEEAVLARGSVAATRGRGAATLDRSRGNPGRSR